MINNFMNNNMTYYPNNYRVVNQQNKENSYGLTNTVQNKAKNMIYQNNGRNTNYIVAEFYIHKDDINKKIRIINSYESYLRSINLFEFFYTDRNEKYI